VIYTATNSTDSLEHQMREDSAIAWLIVTIYKEIKCSWRVTGKLHKALLVRRHQVYVHLSPGERKKNLFILELLHWYSDPKLISSSENSASKTARTNSWSVN